MRRVITLGLGLLLAVAAALPVQAELLSKRYRFKTDVTLQIGESTASAVRLDTAHFTFPATVGGKNMRTGGLAKVRVALSNTSQQSHKVGIAIALYDDEGRLVGVASGGSKLASLKPDRQKTFELVFDDVNQEAYRAATFQISVEVR